MKKAYPTRQPLPAHVVNLAYFPIHSKFVTYENC